jgi:hypothetical protein
MMSEQSSPQSHFIYLKGSSPFRNSLSLAVECYRVIVAAVVGLPSIGSPVTVFRRIGTVVVAAFNRMLLSWTRSHIGKEVGGVLPTVTNFNSSAAIEFITDSAGFFAASFHGFPDIKVWVRREAVCRVKFSSDATATSGGPSDQSGSRHPTFFFAITTAKPNLFPFSISCRAKYEQATEFLAGQIVELKASATPALTAGKSDSRYCPFGSAIASAIPNRGPMLINERAPNYQPAAKSFSSQIIFGHHPLYLKSILFFNFNLVA